MSDLLRAMGEKLKSEEYVTLVFKCDVRSVSQNPFDVDTPFGRARVVAMGDVTDYSDRLEEICHAFAEAVEERGEERRFAEAMALYDKEFSPDPP